jgi:nucleoside-diphosphate-sugar epimerase
MTKRVLLTGATGFVGTRLAAAIRDSDRELVATFYKTPPKSLESHTSKCRYVSCDIADPEAVASLFRDWGPFDTVVNAAAILPDKKPDFAGRSFHTNVLGQGYLVDAAALSHCRRFVYCSSISVYDGAGHFEEARPVAPVSAYGLSKYLGEQMLHLRASSLDTEMTGVSLRFSGIHGLGRARGVVAAMIEAARHNDDIAVDDPSSVYRLCFVSDAVDAIISGMAMPARAKSMCYNAASLEPCTLRHLAAQIVSLSASRSNVVVRGDAPRRDKVMDISAFQRDSGYNPAGLHVNLTLMLSPTLSP